MSEVVKNAPIPAPDAVTAFRHGLVVGNVTGAGACLVLLLGYVMFATPPNVYGPDEVKAVANVPTPLPLTSFGTITVEGNKGGLFPFNWQGAWGVIPIRDGTFTVHAKARTLFAGYGPVRDIKVVVGDTPGPPPPPPPPPPPDPKVVKSPKVLISWDRATKTSLPLAQQKIVDAKDARDYLNTKTDLEPDGKTHGWNMWPSGTDVSGTSKHWQTWFNMAHPAPQWVVIGDAADGRVLANEPLPADTMKLKELVEKYLK